MAMVDYQVTRCNHLIAWASLRKVHICGTLTLLVVRSCQAILISIDGTSGCEVWSALIKK